MTLIASIITFSKKKNMGKKKPIDIALMFHLLTKPIDIVLLGPHKDLLSEAFVHTKHVNSIKSENT